MRIIASAEGKTGASSAPRSVYPPEIRAGTSVLLPGCPRSAACDDTSSRNATNSVSLKNVMRRIAQAITRHLLSYPCFMRTAPAIGWGVVRRILDAARADIPANGI